MITLLLVCFISLEPAHAEPATIINDSTKECTQMEMGDQTHECTPVTPWRLGKCPKTYKKQQGVIALDPSGQGTISKCGARKCHDEDCCRADNASYSAEGCANLAINRTEKNCRLFAVEKDKCKKMPKGWDSASSCPIGFTWNAKPLVCD